MIDFVADRNSVSVRMEPQIAIVCCSMSVMSLTLGFIITLDVSLDAEFNFFAKVEEIGFIGKVDRSWRSEQMGRCIYWMCLLYLTATVSY